MNDFQARLGEAMALKDVSQIELARRTEMNRSLISRYVNGQLKPGGAGVVKIARALNVSPAWLMGFSESSMPLELVEGGEVIQVSPTQDAEKMSLKQKADLYNTKKQEKVRNIMDAILKAETEQRKPIPKQKKEPSSEMSEEEKEILWRYRTSTSEAKNRVKDLLGIGHSEKLAALRAIRDKAQESIDELEAMMRKFEQPEDE